MNRYSKILVAVLILAVLGVGRLANNSIHPNPVAEDTPSPTPEFVVAQQVLDAGAVIGLSKTQLQSVHAQIGVENGGCDPNMADACYNPVTDTIHIYPNAISDDNTEGALAYEWFHHYWHTVPAPEKSALYPDLNLLYEQLSQFPAAQPELNFILGEGSYDSPVFYDEMQSVGCTETYHLMDSALQNHCNSAGLNLQSIVARYQ